MAHNLRIVPAPGGPECMGTEVYCGDQRLKVSRIELIAVMPCGACGLTRLPRSTARSSRSK